MLEHAQTWVSLVLPMLSRSEPIPIYKAAIHLLFSIFSTATHMTEFQRQVSTPNVAKFASSIVALVEKNQDRSLKIVVLDTLTALMSSYSSTMRPLVVPVHRFALRQLAGSFPNPTDDDVRKAAAKTLVSLHLAAGKTGSSAAWKKIADDAIGAATHCVQTLRSTFDEDIRLPNSTLELASFPQDPIMSVPMSLDRLKCMVDLIQALLSTYNDRPVSVPLGAIVSLVLLLLQGTPEPLEHGGQDPALHSLQLTLIPVTVELGSTLLSTLCKSVGVHLTPHAPRLVNHMAHQLGGPSVPAPVRVSLLRVLKPLLDNCHVFSSDAVPSRLVKTVLSSLTCLVAEKPLNNETNKEISGSGTRRGKKRARGYEGDELLQTGPTAPILDSVRSEEVIAALDALSALLSTGLISEPIHSLAHRFCLSLLLTLPQRQRDNLASDPTVHSTVTAKVVELCTDLASRGQSGWAARSTGMVISRTNAMKSEVGAETYSRSNRSLELLIHPRLPPPLKPVPPLESLALCASEESKEEREAREKLKLGTEALEAGRHEEQPLVTSEDNVTSQTVTQEPNSSTSRNDQIGENIVLSTQTIGPRQPTTLMSSVPPNPYPVDPSTISVETKSSEPGETVSSYVPPDWAIGPASNASGPVIQVPARLETRATGEDTDDEEELPTIDMRSDSDSDDDSDTAPS
ncbi:hypothetical protein FRB99_008832 [Tulasnella sp. 403]|nr:hypothetical protein FRB99_008832 [Tulasnella sp. 403]